MKTKKDEIDRRIIKEVRVCLGKKHLTCENGYYWIEKLIIRFLAERRKNKQFQKKIDELEKEIERQDKLICKMIEKCWILICKMIEKHVDLLDLKEKILKEEK